MSRRNSDPNSLNTTHVRVKVESVILGRAVDRMLPDLARATRLAIHKGERRAARAAYSPEAGDHRRGAQSRRGNICQSCGWQHTSEVASDACLDKSACAERAKYWR